MRKSFMWLSAGLCLLAAIQYFGSRVTNDESKVLEVFQHQAYMEAESTVEAYGTITADSMNQPEREQILQDIAQYFQLEDYELKSEDSEERELSELTRVGEKAELDIRLTTLYDGTSPVNYLSVRITLYENVDKILFYQDYVEKLMDRYCADAAVTMSLAGSYDRVLTYEAREQVIDMMLEALEASVITENRAQELFTVYANSKYLQTDKNSGYGSININLASRIDEKEQKTYFYMASPVISQDY